MNILNKRNGYFLIALAFTFVIIVFFIFDPIPQDEKYHSFSDTTPFFNIPNALNVLSNITFFIVGVIGLVSLRRSSKLSVNIIESNKLAYIMLFLGCSLVSLSSGYYHLWPNNETLVWDRLPMTIAFMGLYSIIISEFISEKVGKIALFPLLFIGVASIVYWWLTESRGVGDLRYYAVVQFFPILTIPIMLAFFKSKFNLVIGYWVLLSMYIAAKLFEHFDSQIHALLGGVSGHSIKHVLSACGLYILLMVYKKRVVI